MGPMVASGRFLDLLRQHHQNQGNGTAAKGTSGPSLSVSTVSRLRITLYGSLAYTGAGHATDRASILGLAGMLPGTKPPDPTPSAC